MRAGLVRTAQRVRRRLDSRSVSTEVSALFFREWARVDAAERLARQRLRRGVVGASAAAGAGAGASEAATSSATLRVPAVPVAAPLPPSSRDAFLELEERLAKERATVKAGGAGEGAGASAEAGDDASPLVPPREPDASECCGNDCHNCVWTVYWEELSAYEAKRARRAAARSAEVTDLE